MDRKGVILFAAGLVLAISTAACEPTNAADLAISLASGQASEVSVTAGSTLTIVFFVNRLNQGPKTNAVITVTDQLPQGLTFVSGSGPGIECGAEGQEITCFTFAELYASDTRSFSLEIALDPRLTGTVTNTANLVYAGDTTSGNNTAAVRITATPLPLQTQELDFQRAKNAGAEFTVNAIANEECERLGVGDWLDPNWDGNSAWETGRHPGVVFKAFCGPLGVRQGEAIIEAFKSFRLKNGWVVKSFTEDDWFVGDVAFNIDIAPQAGNCAPLIQAHIRSYGTSTRGDSLPGIPGSMVQVGVQIFIEGPEGTDPYIGQPSAFCEP
jgi:uncharacterized repeat protein (TIGR01451 family)